MSSQKCGFSSEKPSAPSMAARREGTASRAAARPPFALQARRADCSAYQDRKATPNHSTAVVSQGNQVVRACRPDTLAKMKTASISAQMATTLARCARIRPWRDERALRATANRPSPVAVPLAQAGGQGGEHDADTFAAAPVPALDGYKSQARARRSAPGRFRWSSETAGARVVRGMGVFIVKPARSGGGKRMPEWLFVLGRLAMKRGVGARRRAGMMNCRLPAMKYS